MLVLNNSNQITHCKHKGNCQGHPENAPIDLRGVFTDLPRRTLQPKKNTDLRSQRGKYHPLPGTLVHRTERGCAKHAVLRFGPFQTSFSEGAGAGGRLAQGYLAARRLSSPTPFDPGHGRETAVFTRTKTPETTSDLWPLPRITSSAEPNVEF